MNKVERFAIYGALLVAFVLVAIFDLQITQAFFHPDNIVGRIAELFGELPLYLLGTFGVLVLTFHHPVLSKKWNRAILIIGILVAAGVSFYGGHHTVGLLIRNFHLLGMKTAVKVLLYFAFGAAIFGLAFLGTRAVNKEARNEAFSWGLLLLLMVAASLLVMQVFKMIWLRPRYRTLVALQEAGVANATDLWLPFFRPQFFTSFAKYKADGSLGFTQEQINQAMSILGIEKWRMEEFYSFPSGHTMNTFTTISICFFPRFMKLGKLNWPHFNVIARYTVTAFAVFIAVTRIVRGAHNATDVVAGLIFGFVIFDLSSHFFYERFVRERLLPKMEAHQARLAASSAE